MQDFEGYAQDYERLLDDWLRSMGGESLEYFMRIKCEEVLQICRRYGLHPKQLVCYDLGCGMGMAEKFLLPYFKKMIGSDLSYGMLRRASQISNASFIRSDAFSIPIKDKSVDICLAICLFHHIDPAKRLGVTEEMYRITRKRGLILTFEHNPINPITQLIVRRCIVDKGVKLLSLYQLRHLYKMSNIQVLAERYILFFPQKLVFLKPLESLLRYVPFGGQYVIVGKKVW